jgi:hypothetical protein
MDKAAAREALREMPSPGHDLRQKQRGFGPDD